MQEILEVCPSAQRALFSRYHIGGCNSRGYEPGRTASIRKRAGPFQKPHHLA